MRVIVIRVDEDPTLEVFPDTTYDKSLALFQKVTDGYIEELLLAGRPDVIGYCNEEGRLRNLPMNEAASVIFNQAIVGDVVIVGNADGHTVDVPEDLVEELTA